MPLPLPTAMGPKYVFGLSKPRSLWRMLKQAPRHVPRMRILQRIPARRDLRHEES